MLSIFHNMKKNHLKIILFVLVILAFLSTGFIIKGLKIGIWYDYIVKQSFSSVASKFVALLTPCAIVATIGSAIICKITKHPILPKISILWKALLLSLFITLAYNHYIYSCVYLITISVFSTAAALILSYAVLRRYFFIFWIPLLSLSLIEIWSYYRFGSPLNSFMIQETLRANSTEVGNFLTWQNVLFILGGFSVTTFVVWLTYRSLRKTSSQTLLFTGSSAMLLFCLGSMTIAPFFFRIDAFWPASEIRNFADCFSAAQQQEAAILQSIHNLPSPAEKPSSIVSVKPNQQVVCIIHVGESVRADRLGINGWRNNTTPHLGARKELINFRNCISSAPSTCSAILTILSNATWDVQKGNKAHAAPTTGSILDLFTANGFKGAAFAHEGNVSPKGTRKMNEKSFNHTFDRLFHTLTSSVTHFEYINGFSMEQSEQIIRYCKQNENENLVLFVNNTGSHGPFADYDHKNPKFTPSNHQAFYTTASQHAEAVSNAYDNTIAYTDEFIGRVCNALQGRPFVYIYISDHGEYMGENGMWSRAALKKYEDYPYTKACLVPLVFAYSPEFENHHPHIAQALTQMRNNSSLTISQAHLFHTLIGLFGIKTEYHNPELDLTSPQAKPHTGPMPKELL